MNTANSATLNEKLTFLFKTEQGCLQSGLWGVDVSEYDEVLNG